MLNLHSQHSGLRFVAPAQCYRGEDKEILVNRDRVYKSSKEENPRRWSGSTAVRQYSQLEP